MALRSLLAGALAIALLALPATASARTGSDAWPAEAKLVECHTGATDADRYATFRGVMRSRGRVLRVMEMRFRLFVRNETTGIWEHVSAPNLDVWQRSTGRVSIYRFSQTVTSLRAGGVYRAAIDFRWRNARTRIVRAYTLTAPSCRQPSDPRPDLVVSFGRVRMIGADELEYALYVKNVGYTDAGPFDVALAVNGTSQSQPLAGLPARSVVRVDFTAPRCTPGSTVAGTVDSASTVDEWLEDNNVNEALCR